MSVNVETTEYLTVDNLKIKINDDTIVSGLSFAVNPGEVLLILGKKDSVRTKIMRALNDECEILSREILINKKVKFNQIGFMPHYQRPQRETHSSSWEVVMSTAEARSVVSKAPNAKEKLFAREQLKRLGIQDYSVWPYEWLPRPEQQLMLLARALTVGTKILLLEEPMCALETHEDRVLVKKVLTESKENGVAVVIASDNFSEYEFVADKVLCVDEKTYIYITKEEYLEGCFRKEEKA